VESGWEGSVYPEDFFINDLPLQHVLSLAAVASGKWFFDYAADKIYLADDPAGKKIEIGFARRAFAGGAVNVTIQGLVVEKYSTPAQMGAIGDQYPPANWTVQNNEVRLNHGTGITGTSGWKILNNNVHHNGQKGVGSVGTGTLVEGNEISYNNTLHFNAGWEAGGTKFAVTDGLVVRNNYVHDNFGTGLWTDIDNINTLYEGNRVIDNRDNGLSHEISYKAVIRNNTMQGNGWGGGAWLWQSQILIQNSQDVEVYGNTVQVSATAGNGISIVYQNRGTGKYGPYFPKNNYIHHNTIAYLSSQGAGGAVADYDGANFWTNGNNLFDYNNYFNTDVNARQWAWRDALRTFKEFQSFGQELHGTLNGSGNVAPAIASQPVSQAVIAGQTATFTVTATGTAPLSYQWQKNGSNISGANAASYTTPQTTSADNGATIRCAVGNYGGNVTSNNAVLTVNVPNQPPVIVSAAIASPNPALAGQSVMLSAGASDADGDPLSYVWDFGDGANSVQGSSVTHSYVAGVFTAAVSISDGMHAPASSSVVVTVKNVSIRTLHLKSIILNILPGNGNSGKSAKADVTVVDNDGATVNGATVSANWSGLVNGAVPGLTNTTGLASFTSGKSKQSGVFTFTVTNVTAPGYTYDPDQNVVTRVSITNGGVITLMAVLAANAAGATDPSIPISLGTVSINQRFRLNLPLPAEILRIKQVRAKSNLPVGVRLRGILLSGSLNSAGAYVFAVQFKHQMSKELVEQQYVIVVQP
jgi:hypothetical protein